jgi:ParB-like nuclease family protein
LRIVLAEPGETGEVAIRLIRLGRREHRALGDIVPLADSIRDAGLRHPVTVSPRYGLITGRRRLAACQHLGWKEVPYEVLGTVAQALAVFLREDGDPRQALTMTVAERIYRDWQMREELKWWPRAGHNRADPGTRGDHRSQLARGAGLNSSQYVRAYEIILAASGFRRAANHLCPLDDEDKVAAARESAKMLETTALRAAETAYARYRSALPALQQPPPATAAEIEAGLARLTGLARGFGGMTLPPAATADQAGQWDKTMTEAIRVLIRFRRTIRKVR